MNRLKRLTVKGVRIPEHKEQTKDLKVEGMNPPKHLYFPMSMHIGKPAGTAVKVGDPVKIGTLLGKTEGGVSTNIHSSVSGTVVSVREEEWNKEGVETVVIENDYKDEKVKLENLEGTITREDFKKRLEDAGITGKGGAGFPAHIKYGLEQHKARYLVVNGAECEPYSTADHRCMVEYGDEIIKIIQLIDRIYEVDEAHIAVEEHMQESRDALKKAMKDNGAEHIVINELPAIYPQGHSGLQINQVLGIEIEEGQRSGEIGVLQSNVSTIKAIYDAVFEQESFHQRIITVTGPMIRTPKNLMVRLGTRVEEIIEACGGLHEGESIMISGGPMMGKIVDDASLPVDKDTTTLLFLGKPAGEEERACIRCAKCVDSCPVSLQPILISNAYRKREYEMGIDLKSESCIRCGVCTYICPSRISLLEDIQLLNRELEGKDDE